MLRFIFAITVVFAHSWPNGSVFVGGSNAVQLFYIVSGFLISYVLMESKSYPNIKTFYINRYIRLYPVYFVVATLTVIAQLFVKNSTPFDLFNAVPIEAKALFTFVNTFIFGQDWLMFLGIQNSHLTFTSNFRKSDLLVYQGLLIPQAWSLGVELSFYLIAPFVLPRIRVLISLLCISLLLRLYLISIGIGATDPWTYRFFPTELALFLLGALSHQFILPFFKKIFAGKEGPASNIATFFLVIICMIFSMIPIAESIKTISILLAFTALIPLTFIFQNRNHFDSWIGNLSYPIYIGHILVISTLTYILLHLGIDNRKVISILSVIFSIVFAIILDNYIAKPFERVRKKIRLRAQSNT